MEQIGWSNILWPGVMGVRGWEVGQGILNTLLVPGTGIISIVGFGAPTSPGAVFETDTTVFWTSVNREHNTLK